MRWFGGVVFLGLSLLVCRGALGNDEFVFDDPNPILGVPEGTWRKIGEEKKDAVWCWNGTNTVGQTLEIRHRQAASGTTDEAFLELLGGLDQELSGFSIEMLHGISDQLLEFVAKKEADQSLYVVYRTPRGAFFWRVGGLKPRQPERDFGEAIRLHAGREQYTLALKEGNVAMGAWAESIYAYAQMLAERKDAKAESVYRNLLRCDSSNYPAHLEFARLSSDEKLREESLRIVLRDAEDVTLLKEASLLLGVATPRLDAYPVLSEKDAGFRAIFIPLPPCNLWMLEEVAEIYESMTTIPVCIRRLPGGWSFPPEKRSLRRRDLEEVAFHLLPDEPSVKSWSRMRLQKALMKAATEKEPELISYLEALFVQIEKGEFQWNVSPLVAKLNSQVRKAIPADKYTMVVGVTGNDIYGDNTRFLFSLHGGGRSPLSILSYSRMKALSDETQSRRRLVERCAKEMVPATLKTLYIPRSTDPACPYSYANGVQRMDEKTRVLSPGLMEEIARIKKEAEQ